VASAVNLFSAEGRGLEYELNCRCVPAERVIEPEAPRWSVRRAGQPLLRPRHLIRGSGDMLVLSPPRIIVRKRDRNPVPFVVRLSRWTKHGHAARMTIHRFVELAIVAA
jgi:hypothetical protein